MHWEKGTWTKKRLDALHRKLWRTRHKRWGQESPKKKELNGHGFLKPLKGNTGEK